MNVNLDSIILILILGLIGLGIVASLLSVQSRRKAWAELAERLGLQLQPGGFFGENNVVSGVYRSHYLRLDTFSRGSGKSRSHYTRIVLAIQNPAGVALELYQEGIFSRMGKALGMQEIQTGDEELDRRFMIKGEPQTTVVGLLTSIGLRQKLMEARAPHIQVRGQEVYYEKRGIETNIDTLNFLFDLLSDLAQAVDHLS